jgi:hypothetical protein
LRSGWLSKWTLRTTCCRCLWRARRIRWTSTHAFPGMPRSCVVLWCRGYVSIHDGYWLNVSRQLVQSSTSSLDVTDLTEDYYLNLPDCGSSNMYCLLPLGCLWSIGFSS